MVMFSSLTEFVFINAIIYLFCAIVAFAISIFSYRAYKLAKDKNFLLFAVGFFLLAVGIVAHSIGNIAYFASIEQCFFSDTCSFWQKFFYSMNLIFVAFSLYAFNLFIFVYSKVKARVLMLLAFIETSVIAIFLFKTFWFHVVAAVILAFLVLLTARVYLRKKNTNSLLVFFAFTFLFFSHALFSILDQTASYVAHTAEFLSFFLFLIMLLRVKYVRIRGKGKRYGKKK